MSQRQVVYCFSLLSPWSYLGHDAFMALARRHDASVAWRPIDLLAIFPESGGLPLAKRHPKRQAYRDIELQRWRARRGVPLKLRPAFWPLNIALADRTVAALTARGTDPDGFVRRAFAGLWAEDLDLADAATLVRLLADAGHGPEVLTEAKAPVTAEIYDRNTREALDGGVFGAPTYLLDGEPFWGQDRLDLLDEALTSGRPPITG